MLKASPLSVATEWYEISETSAGVSRIVERHVLPWMRCNMWLIHGRDRDLLVDCGMGLRPIKRELAALRDQAVHAVCTHCHFDHIGCAHEFEVRLGHASEASIFADPDLDNTCARAWIGGELLTALPYEGYLVDSYRLTPAPLTGHLDDGDLLDLGDRVFQVLHLPGHSPGSIALYDRATKTLFSGDAIYDGELIDNAWHSEPEAFRESLHRLRELPVETVHAGHFASFGSERLVELIDLYLAGAMQISTIDEWLAAHSGRT
ncbi:MBL fold metallo-hydrolase [Mesorhizobium sp. M0028]|uniref:MBL fold metallo-hydrolase n=1 Tax=Mesorhizobium sp. M0028 TaxID=2956849 RepID=UPI003339DD8E